MLDEPFRSKLRTVEIAPGQACPANMQFSWLADLDLLQVLIQDVDLRVRDGATDRWRYIGVRTGRHVPGRGYDCRLGWAIIVDEHKR